MNVVLYMRYSSAAQSEQSIEGQERVCTEYCDKKGYNIVRKYIDRATSAFKDTDKRTQFQKMIKDSEKGLWDAVIVYKLDRFARNRYDSAMYKSRLRKNNVRVISATENISDDPEGVILESVLEGMAEFYSKELSQKVTRGMRETALKCNSTGGTIPLGYKVKNKKYVVDEVNAEIVREAFDLYNKNYPINEICDIFNDKGYKTAYNKPFNKNSFARILINRKYIGVYKYKDIEIEDGMPAIVSKSLFEKVQEKLENQAKKQRRGRAKRVYYLSQKLFCGHCGKAMVGESATSKTGKVYYYYTCSSARVGKCEKKRMSKEYIEDVIFKQALKLLTPEKIDELAEMAVAKCMQEIENDKLVPALKEELKEKEKAIENLLKFLESGAMSKSVGERIAALEIERDNLEKRLVEAQSDFVILEKDHVVWWLSRFAKGDVNDENFKRDLLDMLVNSVTVYDKPKEKGYRLVIAYNLNSTHTETFESSYEDFCGAP